MEKRRRCSNRQRKNLGSGCASAIGILASHLGSGPAGCRQLSFPVWPLSRASTTQRLIGQAARFAARARLAGKRASTQQRAGAGRHPVRARASSRNSPRRLEVVDVFATAIRVRPWRSFRAPPHSGENLPLCGGLLAGWSARWQAAEAAADAYR